MNILITGGAGFVGSHVTDALKHVGHNVCVLDNLEPQVHGTLRDQGKWPAYINPRARYLEGDIRRRSSLRFALEQAEPQVVIHLAAKVGVGQAETSPAAYFDSNVTGTAVLLEELTSWNRERADESKPQVGRLIAASSMSCYGEGMYVCPTHGAVRPDPRDPGELSVGNFHPICGLQGCRQRPMPTFIPEWSSLRPAGYYAQSKRDTEEMVLHWGRVNQVPTAAVRLFNIYGPRQSLNNPYTGVIAIFMSALKEGRIPIIYEDGYQARDFVHVSDVAAAFVRLVGSMYPRQARKQWVRPESNGVFNVGTGEATSVLEIAEFLAEQFEVPFEPDEAVTGQVRAGDIRCCYADRSRMLSLGWEPKVSLQDGLSELVEWAKGETSTDRQEAAHGELLEAGLLLQAAKPPEAPKLEAIEGGEAVVPSEGTA